MVVDNDNLFSHADRTVIHFSHTNASHIFVVVDGTDEYLGAGIWISYRSGNIVDNRFEQGNHVAVAVIQVQCRCSFFC